MFQPLRDADETAEVPSAGEEDHRLRSGAEDDQTGADRKELSREREGKNVKNVVKVTSAAECTESLELGGTRRR